MSLRRLTHPLVRVPLAVVAIGGAFAGGIRYEREATRSRDEWADARLLSTAIDSVRANALDSLPSDELIRRAVSGMLRELQDPYAALLRPDGYARYQGTLQGTGQGMGLVMHRDGGSYRVTRVAPGSPALAAGVRAGDRILAADGVPVSAARDSNGRVGDSTRLSAQRVRLTLWRAPHGDTVDVIVQRGAWHVPAVSEQGMLADSVGYVRLATITAGAADELEQVVDGLRHRGAQALVLDLRGNTGGLFEDGVRAAGLFLPRGALVSSLIGRGGADAQPYRVRHSRWSELPLTVLVDGRTASAAEVIAAALQDHGRALLVGTPTYGKGLVQRVVRLSPELALRLTTARWLTPRGVALERRTGKGAAARGGLAPDVLLDDASRADPAGMPVGWSASASRRAQLVADTLAMRALRHGWATRPAPLLEAHLRDSIMTMAPAPRPLRAGRQATARAAAYAEWLGVTTRMAMVRVLEVQRESEALLRYAVREDAALRAGLDVVAPGLTLSRR
ncbi:S41 family peptidase [Gemmatimonas sp.]|jgi:carboxyl-terminal processing protease|uniref:S41 family peptidase n=1 Tax=Gemmatimonas sp. TaxID=1962908 RepID=UPI0025BC6605|nr:S41 family peptidase [Gemmatimonas sp.]MCA2985921.1 PDZ domain-containing protein [Gemmatimonas sp.]MCA2989715.1 PDZ domain-containing protein [Gemmatimonas sp.]